VDLPNIARDLDKLATADAIVADSYVRYVLKRAALYFLACLLAIIGFGLLGVALYWILSASIGTIGAAALVGVFGCLAAGIVAAIAMLQRPPREFSVAMEMRRSTIATLEQRIEASPPNPSTFLYPAGEALVSSVLLPLVGALIRSLKSSHDAADEKAPAVVDKTADAASLLDKKA